MKTYYLTINTIVYKILLLLFISFCELYALNVTDNTRVYLDENSTDFIDLNDYVEIFEDINNTIDINTISSKLYENKFIKTDEKGINFGYTNSAYWIKFTVENSTDKNIDKYIELSLILLENIEFYYPYNGTYKKEVDGSIYIPKNDIYRNYVFKLNIPAKSIQTYYIKVHSSTSAIGFSLNLWSKNALLEKEKKEQMFLSFFFGALFIMLIYNFFIFVSIKDKNYIYYCLYLFMVIIHQMAYHGFGRQYIWGNITFFSAHGGALIVCLLIAAAAMFTKSFLDTKKNLPTVDKIIKLIFIMAIVFGITLSTEKWNNIEFILHFFAVSMFTFIGTGFYLLFKGNRQAKFFVVGWSVLLSGLFLIYLKILGILPIHTVTVWSGSIGILLEMTIFSFGLADKIKQAQLEKEAISEQLINEKIKNESKLEKEVANKTKELNHRLKERDTLLSELNHRVKNNMQIIISMLRLQANKYGNREKEIVQIAENRILSMLFIHELLYEKKDNLSFNTKEYFTILIEKISSSYSMQKENFTLKMENLVLCNDTIVALGFIINELFTNAIKHAKAKDELHIEISLTKTDAGIVLCVLDNGTVFNNGYEGLGTMLINAMVDEQLHGSIFREFNNGYKVKIIIPTEIKKVMLK